MEALRCSSRRLAQDLFHHRADALLGAKIGYHAAGTYIMGSIGGHKALRWRAAELLPGPAQGEEGEVQSRFQPAPAGFVFHSRGLQPAGARATAAARS